MNCSLNKGCTVMPIEVLFRDHHPGLKLVPLGSDSKTPVIKSTNEVYDYPEYWTGEQLKQEYSRFANLRTTLGKTHVKDEKGEDLYLQRLDIDSDNALTILFDFLEDKSKTFVTKTRKDCWYHVFWLSHSQHHPIGSVKCRSGYEFEIKSDNSLGLCSLPPSRHKDDPDFKYQCIGREDRIIIDDILYDKLLDIIIHITALCGAQLSCYDNSGKQTISEMME